MQALCCTEHSSLAFYKGKFPHFTAVKSDFGCICSSHIVLRSHVHLYIFDYSHHYLLLILILIIGQLLLTPY